MKGTIEIARISGGSLEGNPLGDPSTRATPVYLPPEYATASDRYPVVYFLHGFTGCGMQWLSFAPFSPTVPERIDRLIEERVIPPVIGVFVDGWSSLGGSQWINSEAIGRYRDYVARDVVQYIDNSYRTVRRGGARALAGKSSGGYGALVVSRFHPDLFGHIAVHSGDSAFEYSALGELPTAAGSILKAGGVEAWFRDFKSRAAQTKMRGDDHSVINVLCMAAAYSPKKGEPLNLELPFELPSGRLKVEVWNRCLVHDPVRFVPKHADVYRKLKTIFLDCGTRDEFNLRWGTRMISEELKAVGVDHLHEEFEDGHMGINYRFERSLAVIVPRLERT